jgi:leucyl/phenylalanyl-tRNA--protein transferase
MQGHAPFWIDPRDASCAFPDVSLALREPDGLLAIGGDLAPQRLLAAYRHGIFPWYNEDQPILWWSPDPRTVLFPDRVIVARRLRRTLRQQRFRLTLDTAFAQVIEACSGPRARAHGTWISTEMKQAYSLLHDLGHAHSVECWQDERLVGGMYGVAVGRVFFGESMFSHARDASKVALVTLLAQLARWGFGLLDCQVHSAHLASLGAEGIPRALHATAGSVLRAAVRERPLALRASG